MKYLTSLFIALFLFNIVYGQTCLPDGITFSSQADIDNFKANNPGCVEILGNVIIDGSGDITNLNGLEALTAVKQLDINNCQKLSSLEGIHNLTEIKGRLSLFKNDGIESLEGLSSLEHVAGQFILNKNHGLEDLSGLENLKEVSSFIQISSNNNLQSLNGIGNLEILVGSITVYGNPELTQLTNFPEILNIGGSFQVNDNPKLEVISGFPNLEFIIGRIKIFGNQSLVSISGFSNLLTIGEELLIYNNASLNDLNGLSGLMNLNGGIELFANNALTSLDGLQNIDPEKILDLKIESSPNLSECNIESICSYLESGGQNSISGNSSGCNSSSEVINACNSSSTEEFLRNELVITPNPARTGFEINGLDGKHNVKLISLNGRVVSELPYTDGLIDITNLSAGIYLVQVSGQKFTRTSRLIIE